MCCNWTRVGLCVLGAFVCGCGVVERAEEEAAAIVQEAEVEAAAIVERAEGEAEAIRAEAEALRQEQIEAKARLEIDTLTGEIGRLTQEMEEKGKKEYMMARFGVFEPTYYVTDDGSRIIEFKVRNETDQAISRAYFYGIVKSPTRPVPWAEGTFNHDIPGGLEPGEQDTWSLEATYLSNWSDVPKDRDDVELTVMPTRIDGADGMPILDLTYAKEDEERLETMRKRMAELQAIVPEYTYTPPPPPEVRPDPADTPPLGLRPEVSGTVYTLGNVYHTSKDCKSIKGATIGATSADSARRRGMALCRECL